MWAKYVNEDYIIEAPERAGGVDNFNEKPEIMKQFDYLPVVDADGFDINKPVKYILEDDKIIRENKLEESPVEISKADELLEIRDNFLQMFSGTRENSDVPDMSTDGDFVSMGNETQALADYKNYLENIENEPGFPNIEVKPFGEWLNER